MVMISDRVIDCLMVSNGNNSTSYTNDMGVLSLNTLI